MTQPMTPAEAAAAIEALRCGHPVKGVSPLSRVSGDTVETDDQVASVSRAITRLQLRRGRRSRDRSITPLVRAVGDAATSRRRRFGQLVELWVTLLPPELAERTTFTALRGGSLAVEAESAAVAYEVNRRLRSGLLAELRRGYNGTLTRVMVSVAGRR